MIIVDWPAGMNLPDSVDWHLSGTSQTPGPGFSGRQQFVWRDNRRWMATITLSARGRQVLTLRALADDLRGQGAALRWPLCNRYTPRLLTTQADFQAGLGVTTPMATDGIPHDGGIRHSDGTGYAAPNANDPVIWMAAPAGSTIVRMGDYLGTHLAVGAYFSVNDFLYRVAANDDGLVRFHPPLRAAIAAGTVARVNRPTILVRLADADGLIVPDNHNRIAPDVSFDVIEAFDRA